MTTELVIVGAGGFGREAIDVARACIAAGRDDLVLLGAVDDAPTPLTLARLANLGVRHLGGLSSILDRPGAGFVIGIGDPKVREALAVRLESAALSPLSLVHPSAVIGTASRIAPGAVICAGAQISTNVTVGRHAHINPNATIGHDAVLGPFASINPGAIVSGEVKVGERALIGAGAVVLQGLSVGSDTTVGAAACVVRDVPDGRIVKGVPAR